jgi:hypothetical protein
MIDTSEIKINLSSDSWDNRFPGARVSINDKLIFENLVEGDVEINWEGDIQDINTLTIEMYNKAPGDTVLKDNIIVNDVILNIDNIEIDDIELGQMLHVKSIYHPDGNDTPGVIDKCVNLGWNGKWHLEFTAPTYLWFLENL